MASEKTKDKNLNQKENKLLSKKINSYTVEKLIRHNNKGKVEPANKMIAEYYARRDKEMETSKARIEQANRGGIYNFSMAKYDNIFKTTNQPRQAPTKQYNLDAANLRKEKVLPIDHFSPQYLAKKNGINISKETDNRPIIDLFDENNSEKPPAVIVYDPVKGIYVMQEPKLGRKETIANGNVDDKQEKETNVVNISRVEKKKTFRKETNNGQQQPSLSISRSRGDSNNKIDPNKKPTFLNEIKEQTNEETEFKQMKENRSALIKKQEKRGTETNFSKKQFLHDLEISQKNDNINLPNYYQTNYSTKKGFRNFCAKFFGFLKVTKWVNKSKRWNK